ncbi:conserved unknown protein [Ectocarpus siliculosus]|uniref:DNA topoisomerase 1 n=1 Tax=Ectocarpus siliculosus TaxID=2880 RepID=D7G042_ECTSI|nr:conserved unknown protein [Ectocarpus siliculosus]|eukprot:CBJ32924.1 conserved unknown protein [Ectocarpus siliculosus]
MSSAAPVVPENPVASSPPPVKADGDRTSSVASNGGVGGHTADASGESNGQRPESASSGSQQQKKRRVIEDDDDDDDDNDPPPSHKPRPAAASPVGAGGGGRGGGGGNGSLAGAKKASGMNGSSSSHSGDRQHTEKRKIVAGPPSKGGGGATAGLGSPAGSSKHPASGGNHDDEDEDDDTPIALMMKKPKAPGAGSSGIAGSKGSANNIVPNKIGGSKNGTKSGGGSLKPAFTIPKKHEYDDDDDFEHKPPKKKRPEDFTRDPAKVARKRKLQEEEERRIKEEAREKKRRNTQGSSSSAKAKAKVKAEPSGRRGAASQSRAPPPRPKAQAKDKAPKGFKEMTTRAEKIEKAMKVYMWWEEPAHEPGKQWDSLEHNGAHFAPEYKPHGVKLKYDGKEVHLTTQQEEVATFYASMPLDGPQLAEQGKVFNKNFFTDFKAVLGKGHVIKDFKLLDFSAIRAHLDITKQIKLAATDGEKAAAKTVKEELVHKYSYAIVDGHLEKVGNYNVEPPGLFRGRGEHPKTGKLKARVTASDIAINCAEGVCVPRCNMPGYAWQSVQHNPSATWLSKWDGLLAGTKYMMLAASSSFKGKSDMAKYDKAMKLKGFIERIRTDYVKKLSSSDRRTKQIATAVWIIDKLALRVGGEKGQDEADTVGCCSLRTEHLTFHATNNEIDLEFLGKDSMLFKETIDFDRYGDVGRRVFKNLQAFCKGKRQSEEVFDYLDPSILNLHLQSLMPGLTAKVFRTYNASDTLQQKLPGEAALAGLSVAEKVALYNLANREVAILCNHQRTVSSAQKEGLEKQRDRLAMLTKQKQELKQMLRTIKSGKGSVPLKSNDKSQEESAVRALEKAKKAKANAKTNAEKVAATKAGETAKALRKAAQQARQEAMHLFAKNPSAESVEERIKRWGDKIKKLQIVIRDRDDNKEVSLSTSKINYMDPRVFAKTLQNKFVWAMNVPPDWNFSYETLYNSKQSVLDVPRPPGGASPKNPEVKGKGKAKKVEDDDDDNNNSSSSSGEEESGSSSGSGEEESSSGEEESGSGSSGEEESGSSGEEESGSESSSGEEEGEESSDDDDDDDDEASSSGKKRRGSGGGGGSVSKKPRRPTIEDDEEEEEEEEEDGDSDFDA